MEINVIVKVGSKENKIEKVDDYYKVSLKARAEKGEANLELIRVLKKYFGKEVKILKGFKSKRKVLRVVWLFCNSNK